jgi:hypothetical protein
MHQHLPLFWGTKIHVKTDIRVCFQDCKVISHQYTNKFEYTGNLMPICQQIL